MCASICPFSSPFSFLDLVANPAVVRRRLAGRFAVNHDSFFHLKLPAMFFAKRKAVFPFYWIFPQRKHSILCEVDVPGELTTRDIHQLYSCRENWVLRIVQQLCNKFLAFETYNCLSTWKTHGETTVFAVDLLSTPTPTIRKSP